MYSKVAATLSLGLLISAAPAYAQDANDLMNGFNTFPTDSGSLGGGNLDGGDLGAGDNIIEKNWSDEFSPMYFSDIANAKKLSPNYYKGLTKALGGDTVPETYDSAWLSKFNNYNMNKIGNAGFDLGKLGSPTGMVEGDANLASQDSSGSKNTNTGGSSKGGKGSTNNVDNIKQDGASSANTIHTSLAGVANIAAVVGLLVSSLF